VLTQLLALRKGRLEQMVNHGTGWVGSSTSSRPAR
jgi:GTP-binding protein